METIKIQKTINEIKYKAVDGTIFTSKEACKQYEDTCKCILNTKYKKYLVKSDTEYNIFHHGSDEYIYDIIKISDDKIKDIILQLFILYNYNATTHFEKINNLLESFDHTDYLLIGRGCGEENYFWPDYCSLKKHINTLNNLLDNIKENIF